MILFHSFPPASEFTAIFRIRAGSGPGDLVAFDTISFTTETTPQVVIRGRVAGGAVGEFAGVIFKVVEKTFRPGNADLFRHDGMAGVAFGAVAVIMHKVYFFPFAGAWSRMALVVLRTLIGMAVCASDGSRGNISMKISTLCQGSVISVSYRFCFPVFEFPRRRWLAMTLRAVGKLA